MVSNFFSKPHGIHPTPATCFPPPPPFRPWIPVPCINGPTPNIVEFRLKIIATPDPGQDPWPTPFMLCPGSVAQNPSDPNQFLAQPIGGIWTITGGSGLQCNHVGPMPQGWDTSGSLIIAPPSAGSGPYDWTVPLGGMTDESTSTVRLNVWSELNGTGWQILGYTFAAANVQWCVPSAPPPPGW